MIIEEKRNTSFNNTSTLTNVIQNLVLENREKLNVSGVNDVLSFDDQVVIMETELGLLTIKGENLKINKLSIDTSEVIVEGRINNLTYSDHQTKTEGGIFGKIWWFFMAGNQTYLFIVFTIVGIIIGVLFDIFRILRKSFKTKDIVTYMEDILFWILTGIIILFSMYKFSNGELRFFMIIGIIMGTLMYMITFSRYVIKISVFIIKIIKTIIVYPVKVVEKILKKIIIRPIFIICINFKKKFINFVKKNKKNRGIFVKKEKYNNI